MPILTDALPAVRHRDADMGVFPTVCHQIIRLLMATCSSCLSARACPTDKQGDCSNLLFFLFFLITKVYLLQCDYQLCVWLQQVLYVYVFFRFVIF